MVLEFVSLGIDPGEVSGWGVALCPEIPVEVGIATTMHDRIVVCRHVRSFANEMGLPIVVSMEDWTIGGPRANYKMFKALGKSSGKWFERIEEILGIPESHVVRAVQQRWRNDLFTPKMVTAHKGSDSLKRLACAFVSPTIDKLIRDHNAAEGGCLACWTHCSEEGLTAAEKAIRRQLKNE